MCRRKMRSQDSQGASRDQPQPENRWTRVMQQRSAVFAQRWFARVDRVEYLIRRTIIPYWLEPIRGRHVTPTSSKPLRPALLLRPFV
jgi:hypothetical protein